MPGFWLAAVLLLLHWGAVLGHAPNTGQLSLAPETTGTLSADAQAGVPAVQPRDVPRTILAEAFSQITKRELAPDRASPWGLVPLGLDVTTLGLEETSPSEIREAQASVIRYAFEARAPPSIA